MDVYSCDCMLSEYLLLNTIVCFCYRNCETQREEIGGQADLAVEHVPWETCALS